MCPGAHLSGRRGTTSPETGDKTMHDTDELVRTLLEGLSAPPCEWRQGAKDAADCTAAATWLMRANCGCAGYFCDDHRESMRATLFGIRTPIYCSNHTDFGAILFDWMPVV